MLTILKTKLAAVLISAVAVTAVAGTSVAAATHAGPFAAGGVFGTHTSSGIHPQSTHSPSGDQNSHFEAQGQITGVTFSAGTTSGTLLFVPGGTTTAVVVQFTAQTHVEVSVAHSTNSTPHGNPGAAGLKVGYDANIVGERHTDGTVFASTIQASNKGAAHQGGEQPTPGPGKGHAPTPGPGKGHDPTPGPGH